MLIDTHAHLTDNVYCGARQIIDNMQADNLERIISIGYDAESSEGSALIAENNDAIYFAAGLHPSEANDYDADDLDRVRKLLSHPKCVAVGEIGLDYHYDDHDPDKQKQMLARQLEFTASSGLPVVFHVRDAYGDMQNIVRENLHKLPRRGVMHCFSGSKETALMYADMGFYISFSGSITFKNAVKFPEIIAALPRDRVLIETDCPYLAPTPFRGKTNYPAYVRCQAEKIADIWGTDVQEVARITAANARACFPKLK